MFFQGYNSPASLGIATAHLNYMLDNFSTYLKGTSFAKLYTEAKSIFLMVRWLCHLSWRYRLFSINICVLIKNHCSWKYNDSPVEEILSINLKLISPVHPLYAYLWDYTNVTHKIKLCMKKTYSNLCDFSSYQHITKSII